MLTVGACHQCSEDLVACVQTNLINYSNLGGGRLASQELKCHCLDLQHHLFSVRKEASLSKTVHGCVAECLLGTCTVSLRER